MLSHVKKRNGKVVPFNRQKITDAIRRAFFESDRVNVSKAERVSDRVVDELKKLKKETVEVEKIQDTIEKVLRADYKKVADAYHDYRVQKAELREVRKKLGVETKLSANALTVLKERYLLKDGSGNVIESPEQLFRRVAHAVAQPDKIYGEDTDKAEKEFFDIISKLEFLPNTPTLMNAGTQLGNLSACFVLPIEDSLDSIFQTLWYAAKIHQESGGTGFSFSKLRPRGDMVRSTKGTASGPVTFMTIFDKETDVIKQGGKRRGANMGILRVDHPDVLEFIRAKSDEKILSNFNVSVAVTNNFMEAVEKNKSYELINPRTGKPTEKLNARKVWNMIIDYAWRTGDPGVVFIDRINELNPTSHTGLIESTNPCGEVPLHPYESCNLGSINISRMVKETRGKNEIDWEKLRKTVRIAVHFLDNIVDANKYPIPEIEKATKANRRIGLGVMGLADLFVLLGIKYDSKEGLKTSEELMRFIEEEGHKASQELGRKRGNFPNFPESLWEKKGYKHMRNATITAIAPTGTISIIAGCSSGIEPLFAVSFVRNVLAGKQLLEVNPHFERISKERGFYSAELMEKIARVGSIQKLKEIPADVRKVFTIAFDISPEWHVKMQAAFQKLTDNATSKTINFAHNAKVSDVKKAYELAWKLGCKGITIYRYGSKSEQVLYVTKDRPYLEVQPEFAGGCPTNVCHVT